MYRSLLLQLLEAYPDLQQVLDDRDLDPENPATYENLIILKDVFFAAVLELFNPEIEGGSDSRRSIYLFIDALDECDEQQAIDMVQYFEELADECTEQEVPFRICLSSRHYPYIVIRHGLELVLEVQPGHTKDLEDYIGNRLRIQDQGLARDLQAELLRKAGGIFLWVILAVNILNTEDSNGRMRLRSTLDEIPDDLHTLFKSILLRDGEKKESLLLGIIWILFSKRPLDPVEYYHALWVGLMLKGLADPDVPSTSSADSSLVVRRFVISSTKGFAEVTTGHEGGDAKVQFIHESVRDFLIKDRGLQQLWPDLGSEWQLLGQERLKESCQAYLSYHGILSIVRDVAPESRHDIMDLLYAEFPFVGYACEYVFDHANTVAHVIPQDDWMSRFPLGDWMLVANCLGLGMFEYQSGHDTLYVLAELGYTELIRTRLKSNPTIAITRGGFEHPLFAALADGGNDRRGSVAALLGSESHIFNGIDITDGFQSINDLGHFADRTPLTWAAGQGRLELIELMIRNGDSIDEEDSRGCTPLGQAMDSLQISACQLLIEKGADPRQGNTERIEYITWASGAEQLGWIELLHRRGVSLAVKDRMGRSALCAALYWGDDEAISFLVDKGAVDYVCGAHGLKRLSWCIRTQRQDLAEYLLSNGLIISRRDRAGRLLLVRALRTGKDRRTLKLLHATCYGRRKCSVAPIGGWTLLELALKAGDQRAVKLLIARGAQKDMTSGGLTPLDMALRLRQMSVVRLLVQGGADVNATSTTGESPLMTCLDFWDNDMALFLIKHGAAVNFKTRCGDTPLTKAVRLRLFDATKVLLDQGADVLLQGSDNLTPLALASRYGYTEIERRLKRYRARRLLPRELLNTEEATEGP